MIVRDPWDGPVEYFKEGDQSRHGLIFKRDHKWTKIKPAKHNRSFREAENIIDLAEIWSCDICQAEIAVIPDYGID